MHAIHPLDLHYLGIPQALAAFVVIGDGGPVLVETGPTSTLESLARGLANLNITLSQIKHALVTHIHLDHAGAAGHLARNGTRIYVHEFGAKHLIDPSRLIDSATRIYKDQMDRLLGAMVPVPGHLVTPLRDGDVIEACGLRFRAIETPGHAKHHHAFALEVNSERVCFAGDAAGFIAPAVSSSFLSVPTPPPEFDLEAWLNTIDRLQSERFDALYLTHFGRVEAVEKHLTSLRATIAHHAEFVRSRLDAGQSRDGILREYINWNRDEAAATDVRDENFQRYVSRNLLAMNVDGLIRYWTRSRV